MNRLLAPLGPFAMSALAALLDRTHAGPSAPQLQLTLVTERSGKPLDLPNPLTRVN
jgi:hypothetical protein